MKKLIYFKDMTIGELQEYCKQYKSCRKCPLADTDLHGKAVCFTKDVKCGEWKEPRGWDTGLYLGVNTDEDYGHDIERG